MMVIPPSLSNLNKQDFAKTQVTDDELRQENKDLRLIVDSLSIQMKNLERKVREKITKT
jgi:hypothetical protein